MKKLFVLIMAVCVFGGVGVSEARFVDNGDGTVNTAIVGYVVSEPIDPFLSSPADGHIFEIPVVILRYLPTVDGINLDVSKAPEFWWLGEITLQEMKRRIDVFDKRVKFMLEEGSKFKGYSDPQALPSLGYKVIAYYTIYEQVPRSDVIISYIQDYPIYQPDYHLMFERLNIESYVNNLGVKEIWIWNGSVDPGYPSYDPEIHSPDNFVGLWESNMSSPTTGDISNSNRDPNDLPIYNSTYIVYGQNFRRTQAEAVHNRGHQLVNIRSSHKIIWTQPKISDTLSS